MTKILYHKDPDGFCSAAIARMAGIEAEMIPMTYSSVLPATEIGETIYMLDYGLQPFRDMELWNEHVELYWIDHHKSAINNAVKANFEASGDQLLCVGLAACELTWMYFHPMERMPDWVRLVGRFDVWDHRDERTFPYHYGLISRPLDPSTGDGWKTWCMINQYNLTVSQVISEGEIIQRYVERSHARTAKSSAFEMEWEGLKFIAINRVGQGSQVFDSVWDARKYDAMLAFGWERNHWMISLYSTRKDVDVSKIAIKHGGGGHKGASGFHCAELPFSLEV